MRLTSGVLKWKKGRLSIVAQTMGFSAASVGITLCATVRGKSDAAHG